MPGSWVRVPPLLLRQPPATPVARSFMASVRSPGRAALIGLGILSTVFIALGASQGGPPPSAPVAQGSQDSVVIAAAGDLVCGTDTPAQIPCLHLATAAVVRQLKPDALLLLLLLAAGGLVLAIAAARWLVSKLDGSG